LSASINLKARHAALKWSSRTRLDNRPLIPTFELDPSVKVRLVPDFQTNSLPNADALIATSWLTARN
jgi:hypothetical protein